MTQTATGQVQAVRYQELIPMLLNELQRQEQELADLHAIVGELRGRVRPDRARRDARRWRPGRAQVYRAPRGSATTS